MRSSKLSGLSINNPPLLRWSRTRAPIAQSQMKVATLNDATEWKLSLAISKGGGSSVDLAVRVKFSEDEGYEPPQGRVIVQGESSFFRTSAQNFWKLGEDPAKEGFDKAGFWIWGLFEEPKYPFFFFELEVIKEIETSTGVIPVGKIFGEAQVTRTKESGVELSEGKLTVKEFTNYQADLIGLSTASVGAAVSAGSFTARPVVPAI
jgi:hypothetical protein